MLLSQETTLRDPAKLPNSDIALYSFFLDRILSYYYIDCVAIVLSFALVSRPRLCFQNQSYLSNGIFRLCLTSICATELKK